MCGTVRRQESSEQRKQTLQKPPPCTTNSVERSEFPAASSIQAGNGQWWQITVTFLPRGSGPDSSASVRRALCLSPAVGKAEGTLWPCPGLSGQLPLTVPRTPTLNVPEPPSRKSLSHPGEAT